MKKILPLLLVFVLSVTAVFFVACNEPEETPAKEFVITIVDGNEQSTINVEEGSGIASLNISKQFATVEGLYLDQNFTSAIEANYTFTQDTTIYVKWTYEYFTVTIVTNDGKDPQTMQVLGGTAIPSLTNPTREYADFAGWYSDEKFATKFDVSSAITGNTTLYAKWKNVKKVSITYVYNYENSPANKKVTADKGMPFTFIADPTREAFEFTGWYTSSDCSEESKVGTVYVPLEHTTLYAGWKLEDNHQHNYALKTVAPTCTEAGYDVHTCPCGDSFQDNEVAALGHLYDHEGETNYFRYYTCQREGCGQFRVESERNYDDVFVYTFTDARKQEIERLYQTILDTLANVDNYDASLHGYVKDSALYKENKAFEDNYNSFYAAVLEVIEQYQYSYVFYCVDQSNADYKANYEMISEYRTDIITEFYSLYRKIYQTKFREYFFAFDEGWTEDDIKTALNMSDSYGGDAYAELNKRADEIQVEFREIMSASTDSRVLDLYAEYVDVNNQIAKLAGYDNYVEYAYENVYGRDYTPNDAKTMQNLCKQYLSAIYTTIYNQYSSMYEDIQKDGGGYSKGTPQYEYFMGLMKQSVFESPKGTELIADYFDLLYDNNSNGKINFANSVNDLFRNGNYFTGKHDGAFSYYISAQDATILYFGPDSYSSAFTFVHEFGHYMNNIYNPGISLCMDHDETQSQGNEMLFLSYLGSVASDDIKNGPYLKIKCEQLFNALAISCLATAVDEFEQAVYTNYYEGYEDGIAKEQYDKLFNTIMGKYGCIGLNPAYWRYVVIEAPCYYISYAMSMLPCIELFVEAEEDFDTAKSAYLKLFTFTDNESLTHIDGEGDRVVDASYKDILHYVGLYSPFEEGLYQKLDAYFNPKKA